MWFGFHEHGFSSSTQPKSVDAKARYTHWYELETFLLSQAPGAESLLMIKHIVWWKKPERRRTDDSFYDLAQLASSASYAYQI